MIKMSKEMWVRDDSKKFILGFVAVILTVCLIGLLILATNEDALAKVHKTINTLNAINVSTEDTYKKKMDILNIHTAKHLK